MTKKRQQKN